MELRFEFSLRRWVLLFLSVGGLFSVEPHDARARAHLGTAKRRLAFVGPRAIVVGSCSRRRHIELRMS